MTPGHRGFLGKLWLKQFFKLPPRIRFRGTFLLSDSETTFIDIFYMVPLGIALESLGRVAHPTSP
jgi:hypothetical protein